jgi:RimJ/RimL family protein N-acetyltransferase
MVDEAARAAVAFAFEALGYPSIWAATDPPNTASIRVMDRLGMRFERRASMNGLDTVFYGLDREAFARSYRIRPAVRDDLAALPSVETAAARLLHEAGFGGAWLDATTPPGELAAACDAGRLWVAVQGDRLVAGMALVTLVDGEPHLAEIDVHPDHGRGGVGARLLRAVIAAARAAGHATLTLTTFRDPPWNAPWYRRHGFVDLDAASLPPALRRLVGDEAARGMPVERRTVMALAL